jgi:hypothetical protein
MTGHLIGAIRAIIADVTAEDVADAVWLLDQVDKRRAEPASALPAPAGGVGGPAGPSGAAPPPADRPAGPPGGAIFAPAEPGGDAVSPPPPLRPVEKPPGGVADWYLPTPGRLLERPTRVPLSSPGVPALPGVLALARALRPLRRRMPSRTAVLLDEEATVRQAVDGGLLIPVHRPAPGRWLELALVVDRSKSMVIWQRVTAELRDLFERLGAFRDVRVWYCDTDVVGDQLTLRPEGESAGGRGRHVSELVDPTGRRVVLVVSDCVGAAWGTGEMADALDVWGRAGPTAIAHTLPQRLWPACAPSFVPVRLAARRPGAPNAELAVAMSDENEKTPDGLAVPVLELEARWFAPWAALVAGTGPDWTPSTAVFTRAPVLGRAGPVEPADPAEPAGLAGPADPEPAPVPPEVLLERYANFASTEAVRLATCLAGAPLNLPVMRLVQQAMLPGSRPSVLAEVFLGGLLRQAEGDGEAGPAQDPDEVEYDFVTGLREQLLRGLSRQDRLTVLTRVSDFISARLGSPTEFRAFLAAEPAASDVLLKDPPFARVALHVLRDMGGRYREAAERLRGRSLALSADTPPRDVDEMPGKQPGLPHAETSVIDLSPDSESSGDPVVVSPPSPFTAVDRAEHTGEDSRQPAIFGGVPYRNPHFTGRQEALERLQAMLQHGTRQMALLPHALHGLGGVGKTQLAVEYAYRYANQYDLVWWVPAESPTTVRTSLAQLAVEMGLPEISDMSQAVKNVLAVLRTGKPYSRWLIVFDNADQPEELRDYLPVPVGHVLVTSRNPRWADVASQLEVNVFTRQESIALLQRRGSGVTAADANSLADRLGDLPLALEQAAAWLAETGSPVPELLGLLDQRMPELLAEHRPTSYPSAVMATWDLSFTRLREQAPGAAQLLELCAFFGSEPIPIALLREGRKADLPDAAARLLRDDIQLRRAIREVVRFALAKIDPTRDRIEIHRLVQAVLREQMAPDHREAVRDAVHRILGAANPGYPDEPRTWDRHADLLPHITPSGVITAKEESGRRAALDQIRYRFIRGDYERSQVLAQEAVNRWKELLGPDDELTLIAQRHLALAMRELGERAAAAQLNQETFDRMTAVFGEEHEHTLSTANSVGFDYRLRGEFQQAKEHDERNLDRHRRVFGDDDPETLRARNNFAVDMRLLGDFRTALTLDQDVYDVRRRVSGLDHPETFTSLANVARDRFDAGEYTEASILLTESLPRIRQQLGETHRITLIAKRVMVMVLRRLGDLGRARELSEELYNTTRQIYRPDHERALLSSVTYANTLLAVGERGEARTISERAYSLYRETFGERHPFTLAAAVDLGVVLRSWEEYQAAHDLDEQAVTNLREALGPDHPHTLFAAINLSNDCAALHDHERARDLSGDAYTRSVEVRGQSHPDTLICGLNHSIDLRAVGDRPAAQALFEQTRTALRRIFGGDHPIGRAASDSRRVDADIEVSAA